MAGERLPGPSHQAGGGVGHVRVRPLLASWLLSALLWGGLLGMYATAQLSFGSRVPQATLLWVWVAGLGAILVILPLLRLLRNRDPSASSWSG